MQVLDLGLDTRLPCGSRARVGLRTYPRGPQAQRRRSQASEYALAHRQTTGWRHHQSAVIAVVFLVYENYVSKGIAGLAEAKPVTLAVMAFRNQSSESGDEFFADGLADELLSGLSRIHELKVASRSASFYFKDKDIDLNTVASTLMVDNVISGSVRREGDRLRITAALDDTENDKLLWSETYDRNSNAILDIQSDIAQSVVNAIVPVLSPESQNRISALPTESAEAYEFYLRGRDYLRQPAETTTLTSAIALFERAIGLDRRFAQAYAGPCAKPIWGAYELAREMRLIRKCRGCLSPRPHAG